MATSHPSRVRGLKFRALTLTSFLRGVAPFTGAWIEISSIIVSPDTAGSRTLHGCVD